MTNTDNIRYTHMISDCRHLLKLLHDPVFLHVYMEQNSAADQLAKAGSRMQCDASLHVFEEPPLFVSSNLRADQIGVTTQRTVTTTATPETGCHTVNQQYFAALGVVIIV